MDVGDEVTDFELPDQVGRPRRLRALLADGPVVLFFYPAASSPVCTKEACHFRDLAAEFAAVGAQPVGISPDPVGKQERFAAEHSFGYPLLSDADGAVAKRFGVWRRLVPIHIRRATFVIGQDRRIVAVIRSELRSDRHADEALQALRDRRASG
jgi:peroxiredoxin